MSKIGEVLNDIIELLQAGTSPEDVSSILDIPLEWVLPAYHQLMTGDPYDASSD